MSKMLDVFNPETGEKIESLPMKSGEEIKEMVKKANKAQVLWEALPLHERAKRLYHYCNLVEKNNQAIGEILVKEMAKPIGEAVNEPVYAPEIGRGYIERAKHLYGEVLTQTTPGCEDDLIFTKREALGVVAAIIPFNFPVEMVIQKSVASMIMGNAVIVKGPSSNPLAVKKMVEIAHEAGIPEDVMQFIVCERDVATESLIKNPDVHAISLTGSTEAGIELYRDGASTMKRIFLELGGNDPLIIREDADLDIAVEETINGRLENNGQVCCAVKRVIVQNNIMEAFVEKLVAGVNALKCGSAWDETSQVTCLVTEAAAIKVEEQIKRTIEQGAKCVAGGTRKGAFIAPTVLSDVPKTADVAKDMEIFGPVYPIFGYDTDEEAVAFANQTRYGLSAGIVSRDVMKAMSLASQIQAAGVVVNGGGAYRHNEQAWGGCKMTGIGYEGVSTSLEEYSRIKTFIVKGAFSK